MPKKEDKDSFVLYSSFDDLYFSELSFEEKGILIDCVFKYVNNGIDYFEALEQDRGLRIAFKAIVDVIDRNNEKWKEAKERRSAAAKKRWANQASVDSRDIFMPGESSITMVGNLKNMPKNYDELKNRTGITNYEQLRELVEYCNHHNWSASLEEMQKEYYKFLKDNAKERADLNK